MISMSIQINLKLSEKMFNASKIFAEKKGYDSIQDFIRELIREKIFDDKSESINGFLTYKASEESLAKNWLLAEEDKSWEHLQKEK
jgi:hypothetical protein